MDKKVTKLFKKIIKYVKMYKEDIMNKVTAIIALIFIIIMFLLYVLIILMRNNKKKQISSAIDRLTTEKNLIISASLITELSKSSKLVNNKKTQKQVEEWQSCFDTIEKTDQQQV